MSLNLATMLREAAKSDPSKPVALFDGGQLSYAELDALSDRFAAGLRSSGIARGDVVALQLPNRGWFHTGDLGCVDDDGYFFIMDRKKDLIIRGGYDVYPREVKEVLYSHDAVAEAAVIGVPSDRLGEDVKAFVQLKEGAEVTEEEMLAFAKERLAAYKYPRFIEFRPVLPKLATGKVDKTALGRRTGAGRA